MRDEDRERLLANARLDTDAELASAIRAATDMRGLWAEMVALLGEVLVERRQLAREVDDAVYPVKIIGPVDPGDDGDPTL